MQRFNRLFKVRHYELDAFGQINDVNLVRYMQEAAIEASTALGFSLDWYNTNRVGWVVRRLSVRHYASAVYGDEIAAATWLSGLRGVRSIREYDLTRTRDGCRLARGRAEWVYMDFQTGQPTRIPDAWADAFDLKGKPEDLGIRLTDAQPTKNPRRFTHRRCVQFHELDAVGHVNHAVYLQWIEQAFRDALQTIGEAVEPSTSDSWRAIQTGHEIQYFAAAVDRENIEIVSWPCETSANSAAWTYEVYNPDSRKLLARDYARMAIVNSRREEIAPSAQFMAAILSAPEV
jgi:acyl-CoA thioester hydrolase